MSRRLIFLSASVPDSRLDRAKLRSDLDGPLAAGHDRESATDRALWLHQVILGQAPLRAGIDPIPVRDDLIENAIVQLIRELVRRDYGFVFGGHPAINAVVLRAIEQFGPEHQSADPWVQLYQSRYFHGGRPRIDPLLENRAEVEEHLVDAELVAGAPSRAASLTAMRRAMLEHPDVVAAIFVGGMRGILEEAALFRHIHPNLPMFAIGAGGGAARLLLEGAGLEDGLLDSSAWPELHAPGSAAGALLSGSADAFTGAVAGRPGVDLEQLRRSRAFLRLVFEIIESL